MKRFILPLATLCLAGAAFAQTPKTIRCAVMPNMKVNVADATKKKMFQDYKGRRYFFCCPGCPAAFKKDPAKYAKKELSIPTPKKKA